VQWVGAGGHDPLVVVAAAAAGHPRAGGASSVPLLLAGVEGGDTRAAANAGPPAAGRGHWRAAAVDGGQEHDERNEARGGEGRPPSPPHGGRAPSGVEVDVCRLLGGDEGETSGALSQWRRLHCRVTVLPSVASKQEKGE